MPGPRIPKYRHHKASGQAVVTLGGRDVYLGKYDTPASRTAYRRAIGEWLVGDRQAPTTAKATDRTVTELVVAYLKYATVRYRHPDGTPTTEVRNIRLALRPLNQLYGDTRAGDFGPLALKALRCQLVAQDLCRSEVNRRTRHVVRAFKWGVSEEIVPEGVWTALTAVEGLRRGRSEARESDPVGPVPDDVVAATLPFLPPQLQAMVRLQRLTAMRPGEVCIMRTGDVDCSGPVWVYTPARHKTAHHGHTRTIFLGPKAQAVLGAFLKADPEAYLFSPREVQEARWAALRNPAARARRRTKRPSQPLGERYTPTSYGHAVRDAARKAGVPHWHPNQLRHAAATEIRKAFDLETSRTVLDHRSANMTQTYAEADRGKAAEAMREIG
jgi:integrase